MVYYTIVIRIFHKNYKYPFSRSFNEPATHEGAQARTSQTVHPAFESPHQRSEKEIISFIEQGFLIALPHLEARFGSVCIL